MPDTPSNQELYRILLRIEEKEDKTNGSVAKNKETINKMKGGLLVVSALVVPLVVLALGGLLD